MRKSEMPDYSYFAGYCAELIHSAPIMPITVNTVMTYGEKMYKITLKIEEAKGD